jgi:hypothetical protein
MGECVLRCQSDEGRGAVAAGAGASPGGAAPRGRAALPFFT